ncbi:MAG TPA: transporter substrate-binding domain-containing protein [Magnetospirillaceae bacterium]|nr:transporter substrate-binding domain-containing protein [Magnetospirillaceae bacterium]
MRRSVLAAILGLTLAVNPLGLVHSQELYAYGEDFPPYSFLAEGEPVGIATDLLRQVCRAAEVQCHIRIYPWARAFRTALTEKNSLVYSTTQTAERLDHFIWLGPFLTRAVMLFTLPGTDLPASRLHDPGDYRFGAISRDASVTELRDAGVPDSAVDLTNSHEDVIRALLGRRITAFPDTELAARWYLKTHGLPQHALVPALQLGDTGGYYFALNPSSDPELVRKMKLGYEAVMKTAALKEILGRYLGEAP